VERAGAYELRAHYDNDGVRYGPDGSVAEDRNAYVGTVSIE
jgi:hypothetical protein